MFTQLPYPICFSSKTRITFKPFLSVCTISVNPILTPPYLSDCHSVLCGLEPAYRHTFWHTAARIIFLGHSLIKICSYSSIYPCNLYGSDQDREFHLVFKTSVVGNLSFSYSFALCLTPPIDPWVHHTCRHIRTFLLIYSPTAALATSLLEI